MIGLLVPKTTKVCTGGYTQSLVLRHVILMVRVVFQGSYLNYGTIAKKFRYCICISSISMAVKYEQYESQVRYLFFSFKELLI